MRSGSLLAVSALFLVASPMTAAAADLKVPPPTAAYTSCPPQPVQVRSRTPLKDLTTILFRRRNAWVQAPEVVTVEPFHGPRPNAKKYVPPQTAYLASSPCPPSLGHAQGGSWYDGKVFYYDGQTPHHPDMFMVVTEPGVVHWPLRLFRR